MLKELIIIYLFFTGHGFSREWRAGWTDDGNELI
jgi:hypothetical protein